MLWSIKGYPLPEAPPDGGYGYPDHWTLCARLSAPPTTTYPPTHHRATHHEPPPTPQTLTLSDLVCKSMKIYCITVGFRCINAVYTEHYTKYAFCVMYIWDFAP